MTSSPPFSIHLERHPARVVPGVGVRPAFHAATAFVDLGDGRTLWPTDVPSLDVVAARARAAAIDAAAAVLCPVDCDDDCDAAVEAA